MLLAEAEADSSKELEQSKLDADAATVKIVEQSISVLARSPSGPIVVLKNGRAFLVEGDQVISFKDATHFRQVKNDQTVWEPIDDPAEKQRLLTLLTPAILGSSLSAAPEDNGRQTHQPLISPEELAYRQQQMTIWMRRGLQVVAFVVVTGSLAQAGVAGIFAILAGAFAAWILRLFWRDPRSA